MVFRRRSRDLLGRTLPEDFTIGFDRHALAEVLWQYGEDELAARAARIDDEDLAAIQELTVWHHVNDPDEERPRLLNGRVIARGAIDFFEGRSRDTVRRRRRTRSPSEGYLQNS